MDLIFATRFWHLSHWRGVKTLVMPPESSLLTHISMEELDSICQLIALHTVKYMEVNIKITAELPSILM